MPYVSYSATRDLIAERQPSELVTNGDFATDTDWTKGTGWTIGSGVATATAGAASDIEQDITVTEGLVYDITYTITVTAGTITPKVAGTSGTAQSSSGTYTESITAGSGGTPRLEFTKDASFAGTLDNVSVSLGTNTYDLEFDIIDWPVSRETRSNTRYSLDNTPQTTVLTSNIITGTITASLVTKDLTANSTWLKWQEFFSSVREGELFTIDYDESATVASPVNAQSAICTAQGNFQRVDALLFNPVFNIRVV